MPKRRLKVIHIMNSPPAYDAYSNSSRPIINFDTPNGEWVGIWGYDWPDLISQEVFKVNRSIDFEVWQPDLRADKIYSHTFDQGFKHKLFPAKYKKIVWGLKRKNVLVSEEIIKAITHDNTIIIHLHGNPVNFKEILKIAKNVKIVHTFHGVIYFPQKDVFKLRKNFLASINYVKEFLFLKKHINNIDVCTYMNKVNLSDLTSIFKGNIENLTMGVDFDAWQPTLDKNISKKKNNVKNKTFVLTAVSRLVPLKQLDKVITILNQIEQKQDFDFVLFIGGNGEDAYVDYLKELSKDLIKKGKIKFLGYLKDQEVLDLYHATDLFMLNSTNEGCPVSVVKALACELPVFTTDVGHTADVLKEEEAGVVVSIYNYNVWEEKLTEILKGKQVITLNRDTAHNHYDWNSISKKFNDIYLSLENN
jgi:glycosyltransferase involved in cell wall biosynthesis